MQEKKEKLLEDKEVSERHRTEYCLVEAAFFGLCGYQNAG